MKSLLTNPRDAEAAITGSGFASLGDAPFYRGSVNTGDGNTVRQRHAARATTFMSFIVRRRNFSGGAFVILITYLRSSSSTAITHVSILLCFQDIID